ncbi:MAG TPA: gluconeogenesis factor YvcK family protein [Oscillospiraceae bacterium]|nr:gluconeogenesis factor YvcK family protein [Oscillospiraceae bacterium]
MKIEATASNHYERGKELMVAALGGGTGLSTLLRGLKNYTTKLAAIVSVADDGGSSGRLRQNLGILPPGDIRNCLLALANTEPLLEQVFQHRFLSGEGLAGHNFGNLFLAALTEEFGFEKAIRVASRVLAVTGEVLPVSMAKLNLVAELTDGRTIRGQSRIPQAGGIIRRLYIEPATADIYPAARKSILAAQLVVVGPGSLYTSVLANLLVPGVVQALRDTAAHKVYVCNVMTQPGETEKFSAADHFQVLTEHVGTGVFDTILINNNLHIPAALLQKYAAEGAIPVQPDLKRLQTMGVRVVAADLLSPVALVRHDPDKLACAIFTDVL